MASHARAAERGMSMGKNDFLSRQREIQRGFFEAGLRSGRQQIIDMVSLVLRDPDIMGKDISAIARNGALLQSIVALEELSEAQKEICKFLRDKGDLEHLAEEVADATIMLEQIRVIFGINERVNAWIDTKVQRLADRVKGE